MYEYYVQNLQYFNLIWCFCSVFLGILIGKRCQPQVLINVGNKPENIITNQLENETNTINNLLSKLSSIYDNHIKKEQDDALEKLKNRVPEYVLERIPKTLLIDFNKATEKSPKEFCFASFFAMDFLKKYGKNDKIVLDWLTKHYELDISK